MSSSRSFSVFIFLSALLVVTTVPDDCEPDRCGKHGPIIRFPFRIKNRQPDHCSSPGFSVYCDDREETVLVLPSSVNLTVKNIDYVSQQLLLYDPQICLPRKLQSLNLSASPFNFSTGYTSDFILFNCSVSSRRDLYYYISCLSDSKSLIYAVEYNDRIDELPVTSCTNVDNISSVPRDVFDENALYLTWSEPACGKCEAQGKRCTAGNFTGAQSPQCIDVDGKDKGTLRKLRITGETLGSLLVGTTVVALVLLYIREKENQKKIEKFLGDYKALKPTRFSYSDLRRITNQFSEKLGEGGYGTVYKGKLTSDFNVAVKVLNSSKENGEEFVNEVSTIGRIHHVNVVRLVGFCAEGFKRVLVYEFLPKDSLEKLIYQTESSRTSLDWEKLQDIALGIAKGIEYLHQGCDQQILHFDIKPHNILLDQNLNPKICDFGLAKLCSKEQSGVTMTAARGTMGYIAPEVLSRTFGKVSYKSDVYSFGMLLLEMVGGRKNVDPKMCTSQAYFPKWVYNHLNLGDDFWKQIEEGDQGNIARKLTIVGLSCIHWCPSDRPCMKAVVQMLEGDEGDLGMPPNPFPATNVANFIAGIHERHYQAELPLILEIDE